MIEPETQIRAVGFHSREGQGYISGVSGFPFYCSLLLKDSEGAKVHLLILLPAKHRHCHILGSVQFSCSKSLSLCDPMYCSTPGFLVHCELLELAQTHVHWDGDAIQISHPLSSPSPPAFNFSLHQGRIQWINSSHQVAKELVLPMNIQERFSLGLTGWISLHSTSLLQNTVQKHQFFGAQFSL